MLDFINFIRWIWQSLIQFFSSFAETKRQHSLCPPEGAASAIPEFTILSLFRGFNTLGLCRHLLMTVASLTQLSIFDKTQRCSKHRQRNCYFQILKQMEFCSLSCPVCGFSQGEETSGEGQSCLSHHDDSGVLWGGSQDQSPSWLTH